MFTKLLSSSAGYSVVLIRLMVGCVFLSEGIQKFLYPDTRGVGRFIKIGLPEPEFLANFVASFEIACGVLIILGLLTRLSVIPTIIIMLAAIGTTKLPMLGADGFWEMAHAARTDFAMLLGSLYLLIVGGGTFSLDRCLLPRKQQEGAHSEN